VRVRPAGCPDELAPEVEDRDQHRLAAAPSGPCASDASGGVHRAEAADAAHRRRVLADVDAEKSAGQERAFRVPGAQFPLAILTLEPQDAAAELCTQDAVRSAERSCAAQAAAAQQALEALRVAEEQREQQAEPMLRSAASQAQPEPLA